jgi:hypothetical protein
VAAEFKPDQIKSESKIKSDHIESESEIFDENLMKPILEY